MINILTGLKLLAPNYSIAYKIKLLKVLTPIIGYIGNLHISMLGQHGDITYKLAPCKHSKRV